MAEIFEYVVTTQITETIYICSCKCLEVQGGIFYVHRSFQFRLITDISNSLFCYVKLIK